MKKFFNEFKEFTLRGNVVDLAIGVIIGAAFQSIINAFIESVISPLLGFIISLVFKGNMDALSNLTFPPNGGIFKYGLLLTSIISFIITALVLFLIVRAMNRLTARNKEEPTTVSRKCPYCLSDVDDKATRCPSCTSMLDGQTLETTD